ncbi:MAG: TonB-dependent receptor [Calditrichaceae bacterium]|nr:TonB-dependent receptor [Calditrichaceae bacterium]MBN2708749.1 TonB-dependent receptor [Calditrichaceae bacterium]RQV97116.1 MAG: TonB-dependent receptor [Calditrichota bacterium]
MQKLYVFYLTIVLLFMMMSSALSMNIKGLVRDARTSEPLTGVNVFIEGTAAGSTTDADGYFEIKTDIETDFVLTISYVGYKTQKLNLTAGEDISLMEIELQEDVFESETIVVTGIASKTSKDVAEVAVSRVNASNLTEATAYQSVSQLVAGKVSGVQLTPATGNVGGGFRFYMRSGGGLNGDGQPIVYLDGVRIENVELEGDDAGGQGNSTLADINPEDIENIEVLKGSAGAASYGTDGSNGVVIITTKKGKLASGTEGGISLNYKYLTGINTPSHKYSKSRYYTADDMNDAYVDGGINQHSLSAAGGNNTIRYFASFDKRNEEGILNNNSLERTSVRANIDVFAYDNVTFRFGGNYILNEISRPQGDNNILGHMGNVLFAINGEYKYFMTDSLAIEKLTDVHKVNRFIGNSSIVYNPVKNLELTASIGLDISDYEENKTYPSNYDYSGVGIIEGDRLFWLRKNSQYTYDFNARYKYDIFKGLQANTVAGAQLFDRTVHTRNLESTGFSSTLITDIGAGLEVLGKGEFLEHTRKGGLFAEHSMSYINQYFLTLGIRQDFATAIADKAGSIFYPKASLAVRMDRYSWFPSDVLNLFKLRMAYGESGQLPDPLDIVKFVWTSEIGGYGGGAVLNSIGNPDLKAERIKEVELGFEAEFLTNYSIEFTYYQNYAENSIIPFQLPPTTGLTVSRMPFNVGGVEGWGMESLLKATPLKTSDYQVDMSLINNFQKNEVTDIGDSPDIYDSYGINVYKEGLAKHEFYAQVSRGALFDDDGYFIGTDVTENRVSLGNPYPDYSGSFMLNVRFLKNFNFYALGDWALGLKVYNNTRQYAIDFGNDPEYNGYYDYLTNPDNEPGGANYNQAEYRDISNKFAKLDTRYPGNFIEDADFFKLREISLYYNFKDLIKNNLNFKYVSSLIIGVSARNFWMSTVYSGPDPEVNADGSRSLTRGVDFLTLQNPTTYNIYVSIGL